MSNVDDIAANPRAASQSFRRAEVEAMCELFRKLRRGGDARTLMRSTHVVNAERKFYAMQTKLADRAKGAEADMRPVKPRALARARATFEIPDDEDEGA